VLFIVVIPAATALLLLPAFVQIDCGTGNILKCWVYKFSGPFLGVLIAIIPIPLRRFLLGEPVLTLTRDGIDSGLRPIGMIPWAHIEDVEIKHVHFAEHLVIRRKADTVPPPKSFIQRRLSAVFGSRPLYVSPMFIDHPLHHLNHWVDEGRRNATAGVLPDPFFTVPY
jgi:hypothetical protein